MNLLISGYIIGSPTNDKAQCCGFIPSANLSDLTPGTPTFLESQLSHLIQRNVQRHFVKYDFTFYII